MPQVKHDEIPQCEKIAINASTTTDPKDKFMAFACMDECYFKEISLIDDNGELKKDSILKYVGDKYKEFPEFFNIYKNATEVCIKGGEK